MENKEKYLSFIRSMLDEALNNDVEDFSDTLKVFIHDMSEDDMLTLDTLHYIREMGINLDSAVKTMSNVLQVHPMQVLILLSLLKKGTITSNSPHLQPDTINIPVYEWD